MNFSIVIADDHEVVREGLASLLTGTHLKIVGEATNGEEAVEAALALRPDVVVMDIRMCAMDGLTSLDRIKQLLPKTAVVMFSTYDNPTYIARSIALGASDYVLKSSSRNELVEAIDRAARGEPPPRESVTYPIRRIMERRQKADDDDVTLTRREMQILRHVALGLNNREIALSLDISVETVKEHVQNILRKLQLDDRTQAAVWAVRRHFV
jgi:DNA-binding NarL/FixJ family response regulator